MLILYSRSCELRRKLVLVVESFPTIERSQYQVTHGVCCTAVRNHLGTGRARGALTRTVTLSEIIL
jgi:hypothetical protein